MRRADGRAGIAIRGVGLATAQGSSADLRTGGSLSDLVTPPWSSSAHAGHSPHRPARGLDSALAGPARLTLLARRALEDCLDGGPLPSGVPVLLASCNGNASTADLDRWRRGFDLGPDLLGRSLPVISAACASGLHALYLGTHLIAAGADEVVVLAVDIDSAPAHTSFESLRILSTAAGPAAAVDLGAWQPGHDGFVPGEAAVALRLGRAESSAADAPGLSALALGHDLPGDDGLMRVLAALELDAPTLVLGQGTGPPLVDRAELAAIRARLAGDVPLGTALHHFGHTLGASGLLSVALAALAHRAPLPSALAMPVRLTSDGRPLVAGAITSRETVIVCRGLGGACVAATVGPRRAGAAPPPLPRWRPSAPPPPLRDPNLRRLAAAAAAHRPSQPPDLLLVRLEAPLIPPPDARRADRLLPSSILEMTPGFVAQLLAQMWGFAGAAICMVAGPPAEHEGTTMVRACQTAGASVHRVDVLGQGEDRDVVWNC